MKKNPPSLPTCSAPAWQHYGFALVSATVLGALVHLVRIRTLHRLERLRLQNESYGHQLERRVDERTNELHREIDERRINAVDIQLPPLRERREDIPLLAAHSWSRRRSRRYR